ncbi:MAG TPA: heavy metal translocating P-type ATPase [Candidatus Eisenbacteria bacterium]
MTLRGTDERIAALAVAAIAFHLALRWGAPAFAPAGGLPEFTPLAGIPTRDLPLLVALVIGGGWLVFGLVLGLVRGRFSSDLLAGLSIVTSVLLGEYLAGVVVVLMLAGGQALETYAARRASSVLAALAKRMPSTAHRLETNGDRQADVPGEAERLVDIPLDQVAIGDRLTVYPHETCPVDGTVVSGHGSMDESYLTGEPYRLSKAPGTRVLSGAINGETALVIRADRLAVDSRYASIMAVMRESEQRRPHIRRLADRLGTVYTPLAVGLALIAWWWSGEATRFLAVLVVATPCPLIIAIPVAIIASISLAARRGIIIRDPSVLETIDSCRTALFDKTGTLTYGQPELVAIETLPGYAEPEVLALAAALERYSRHPLARAILDRAGRSDVPVLEAVAVSEPPGQGLTGRVGDRDVRLTGRSAFTRESPDLAQLLPPHTGGMECVVIVGSRPAALFRFRDEPRGDSSRFIRHLSARHGIRRLILISGDRESEVQVLAGRVGITEVHAGQSPEQKVTRVRTETALAPTLYLGDGINDAPALTAATVGIAFGQASDVTSEAAGAVVLDSSLQRVDELLHIGRRFKRIALQSAVGGMALSIGGMILAAVGLLPPVGGAVFQEVIDVAAVLNALRAAAPPASLTDYGPGTAADGK